MKSVQTLEDLYGAIDQIIAELRSAGYSTLAEILHHRLHKVAWTSSSELLEELQNILSDTLKVDGDVLPVDLASELRELLGFIDGFLAA